MCTFRYLGKVFFSDNDKDVFFNKNYDYFASLLFMIRYDSLVLPLKPLIQYCFVLKSIVCYSTMFQFHQNFPETFVQFFSSYILQTLHNIFTLISRLFNFIFFVFQLVENKSLQYHFPVSCFPSPSSRTNNTHLTFLFPNDA